MSAPVLAALKLYLDERSREPVAVIALPELARQFGFTASSLTPAQLEMIAEALARCGFGLEPDPRVAYSALATPERVVCFSAGKNIRRVRPEFASLLVHADIGPVSAMASRQDFTPDLDALQDAIVRHPFLTRDEKKRLIARFTFLAANPPSAAFTARFKGDRSWEATARLGLAVATADGVLSIDDLRLLETLHRILGLPVSTAIYGFQIS